MTQMWSRLAVCLALCSAFVFSVLGAAPAGLTPAAEASSIVAQPGIDCDFTLGFAAVRDLLSPAVVGDCVENERFIAGNGNSEQRTTNGMLAYTALYGYVRFIGSDTTWIVGPEGLVQRPNNERFEWEGDRQLVESLRSGGYFIYFRHGATDSTQTDAAPPNLPDCTTQRNLTDGGRDQAALIGVQLRALKIPVGQVVSSPYCRALQFSNLMFGRVDRSEPSMQLPDPLPVDARQRNSATFETVFTTPPAAGSNIVMVAHSPNIRDIFEFGLATDLPVEGGAVILSPNPAGGRPNIMARILPDEWSTFAEAMAIR